MNITTDIEIQFFEQYIIEKVPKNIIQSNLDLTDRQYFTLVQIVKKMDKNDITLDEYMTELNRQYIICKDSNMKLKLLLMIGNIIEKKHKIPQETKEQPLDASVFTTETPVHS